MHDSAYTTKLYGYRFRQPALYGILLFGVASPTSPTTQKRKEKAHAYQTDQDGQKYPTTRARTFYFSGMGAAFAMIAALQRGYPRESTWAVPIGVYAIVSVAVAVALARLRPDAFLQMSAGLLLLWASTTVVAAASLGQWYVHRRFAESDFVRHNEVGGFIVSIVGSLYGVLLGFMTVIAWQHFAECTQLVAAESAAATDAWHTAIGLPAQPRSRVRKDMLAYADAMIEREWPAMRHGDFDRRADWIVMDAIGAAGGFNPRTLQQADAQNATLSQLGALHDDRQRRLSENRSGILPFEWLVLALGGACIVGFCWLFGVENKSIHLIMTSTVTVIVTATLVLLFELQYPFQTDLRIQPSEWHAVVSHIQYMLSGPQTGMRM